MNNIETGQLIGAAFLAFIVVSALVSSGRHGWGKTLKQTAAWGVIFIVAIAGAGLWMDIQDDNERAQAFSPQDRRIEVLRARDGHYYLTLNINDKPVDFVVDTGASSMVLTRADAEKVGLDYGELRFFGRANTANGEVKIAHVSLNEVRIGNIVDTDVRAFVNEGEMFQSLLGMSYLQLWDHIEIRDNALVLTR